MEMSPTTFPDKLAAEKVDFYFQLTPAITPDTISGTPVFSSEPAGLVFSDAAVIDSGRTAVAFVAGGEAGTEYLVSALCTLVSGEIVQPVVSLRVVSLAQQTSRTRPQVL